MTASGTSTARQPVRRANLTTKFRKNMPAWIAAGICFILLVLIGAQGGPAQLINTLVTGGMWALMSVGLALIFGVMNIPHFAHGESFMIGAMVAYFVYTPLHKALPAAHPNAFLTAIVPFVGMAVATARGRPAGRAWWTVCSLRPCVAGIREGWVMNAFLLTVGLSFVLVNGATLTVGPDYRGRTAILGRASAAVPGHTRHRGPAGGLRHRAGRDRRCVALPAAHQYGPGHPGRLTGRVGRPDGRHQPRRHPDAHLLPGHRHGRAGRRLAALHVPGLSHGRPQSALLLLVSW